jgi:hypothetical protein
MDGEGRWLFLIKICRTRAFYFSALPARYSWYMLRWMEGVLICQLSSMYASKPALFLNGGVSLSVYVSVFLVYNINICVPIVSM